MRFDVRYRRVPYPTSRRGVRPNEAARRLGIPGPHIYELIDEGWFALWFDPVARGMWLDADEVDRYADRQQGEGDPPASVCC